MKNITLSMDDTVLAAVRRYASEKNTTVNGLVRDYFTRLAAQEDKAAKARQRLKQLSEEATLDLGNWKWNRDELYDRGMLSRHERPPLRGLAEPGGRQEEEDRG